MSIHALTPGRRPILTTVLIVTSLLIAEPAAVYGHGGKTHAEEPFSAFQAVQKATQLYDQLIVSGKLPEAWETGLVSIHITIRGAESAREYVVAFKRNAGEPRSVYFYFDRMGEYAGSNFTGQ